MSALQMSVLVGAGGFVGSVLRFWVGRLVYSYAPLEFPWGTFAVNVLGSFLIGVLMEMFAEGSLSEGSRLLLAVGVLGGFTTFSAFSQETVAMITAGASTRAAGYVVASVVVCLLATWAGVAVAKWL